jgi:hypothetical protein
MSELSRNELTEINGGSEYSYQVGKKIGEDLRKAVDIAMYVAFFFHLK